MSDNRKLRVFLCHSSQDKPIVRELYQRLLAEGWIDPWLDEEKLLPGQDWGMEIEKAVEVADVVIVCISDNSVTKEGYVQKELRKALDVSDEKPDGTIFVIPVRVNDLQIPRRLKNWQYVDFFPTAIRPFSTLRILSSLKRRAESISIPIATSSSSSEDDKLAIEICVFDKTGNKIHDSWYMVQPNSKVDMLIAEIKDEYPDILTNELGDYKIQLDLPFHYSINDLKVEDGSLISIRPK